MLRSPDERDRVIGEVIAELQAAGLGHAAQRLAAVQNGTFTTGSEFLGELRGAVQKIRRAHRLPRELSRKLKQIAGPTFGERIVFRALWQGIMAGTTLLILGAAVVALVTAKDINRYAPAWIAGAVVSIAVLWIAVRQVSVCPGCGTRIRQQSPAWCPYCGSNLASGVTGPQVSILPSSHPSSLLHCPNCGNPPGGKGRHGTPYPTEGHFCSSCGTRLPEE